MRFETQMMNADEDQELMKFEILFTGCIVVHKPKGTFEALIYGQDEISISREMETFLMWLTSAQQTRRNIKCICVHHN